MYAEAPVIAQLCFVQYTSNKQHMYMQRAQLATVFYHFTFIRWLDMFMRYYGINMSLEKRSSRAEAFEHIIRFNKHTNSCSQLIMLLRNLLILYLTGHIVVLGFTCLPSYPCIWPPRPLTPKQQYTINLESCLYLLIYTCYNVYSAYAYMYSFGGVSLDINVHFLTLSMWPPMTPPGGGGLAFHKHSLIFVCFFCCFFFRGEGGGQDMLCRKLVWM